MITPNTKSETSVRGNDKAKLPTHIAKIRRGYGRKANYERIGVAWKNEDGSLYVKLAGTQVVSALTLYELQDAALADDAAFSTDRTDADEEGK